MSLKLQLDKLLQWMESYSLRLKLTYVIDSHYRHIKVMATEREIFLASNRNCAFS